MAQAPTTEKKKRKPFTRTEKPVYVILGYRETDGTARLSSWTSRVSRFTIEP
jgi:hypothetical protein